jgi:hypothetical protein
MSIEVAFALLFAMLAFLAGVKVLFDRMKGRGRGSP